MPLTNHIETTFLLQNKHLELYLEEKGGVIRSLVHHSSPVNPLSFRMLRGENPGDFFSGHFVCAPRWGDVSDDEQKTGAIKHGDISLLNWDINRENEFSLSAKVFSEIDQIRIERRITISQDSPVISVSDTLTNTDKKTRPCNIVQHPTIAFPFLNEETRIDSNAGEGSRYMGNGIMPLYGGHWPNGLNNDQELVELNYAGNKNTGVYSFSIDGDTGWVTAIDPRSDLLLGYCWETKAYPFVHHWIHSENEQLLYRGLEFGTAALHQPFEVLKENKWMEWQGSPACFFLEPGESKSFAFKFFLLPVDGNEKINDVAFSEKEISIKGNVQQIVLNV